MSPQPSKPQRLARAPSLLRVRAGVGVRVVVPVIGLDEIAVPLLNTARVLKGGRVVVSSPETLVPLTICHGVAVVRVVVFGETVVVRVPTLCVELACEC